MICDLISLASPGVADLCPYQPGKPMADLERELGIPNIIKLASNENPLGPSSQVMQVLSSASHLSRYPDGNGHQLKLLLAEYHGVNIDQITLGNGSNEIFELLTRAIVSPQHEVIFSEYAFAVYPLVTQAVSATAVVVPAQDWCHSMNAMQLAINKKSRIMFIANPNNPTGTWVSSQALQTLLQLLPEHMLLVIDEAYFDYVQEDDYCSCIQWINEFPQLVVTRTFSKAFGLAGLRIGYAVSHSDIADLMNRVRQPFNVNSLALSVAAVALKDTQHLQQSIQLNAEGMQQLINAFDSLGLQYIPSVGNFICIDMQQAAMPIYRQLLHQGVIVRPLESYGMPNYLRITVGLQSENEQFITALKTVLVDIDAQA